MTNKLTIIPQEYGLTEETALGLTNGLEKAIEERKPLIEEYSEIKKLNLESEQTARAAASTRKRVKNNRTQGIEKWHKENKEYYLKVSQYLDARKREEVQINLDMEKDLLYIENYIEERKKEEIEKLRVLRNKEVEIYDDYVPFGLDLGTLSEEEYKKVFNGAKLQYEAQLAAEKKAEEERIEAERIKALHSKRRELLMPIWDFEKTLDKNNLGFIEEEVFQNAVKKANVLKEEYKKEQERIRLENEKLKKEAEEKERELEAERIKAELALEKEREENEKKLKEQLDAKRKLEEEIAAKKAEEKRIEDAKIALQKAEEERIRLLSEKSAKEQLTVWIESFSIPSSPVINKTSKEIEEKFEAFKKWAFNLNK
jgi:hypothetical protein